VRSSLSEEETVNHLRWIVLVAVSMGCVGCQRDRDQAEQDRTAQAPTPVTPRRDMPRTDEQQRADMPRADQQRADMPRGDQQRTDMPRGDTQRASAAVNAISTARCEREQRCGHIGPQESYTSMEQCETQVRHEWAHELSGYECPRGVQQAELTECVTEIRQEDCANPFDTLARATQCRQSDICQG
jgi:hypothetical protein